MSLKLPVAVFVSCLLTISSTAYQTTTPGKAAGKPTTAVPSKADDERIKHGKALLSQAEAEAGGLEGEMRAYALLQAARAYSSFDPSRASELLEQAYTASQVNHEETPSKTQLVQQILLAMAKVDPQHVEQLLPYTPPQVRARVLNVLLSNYIRNKEFERAKEMLQRNSRDVEFPYRAAAQLMAALPKQNSVDRQAIFGAALTSFKASSNKDNTMLMGLDPAGLTELVIRFWRDLPVSAVKEAIDVLLDDAQKTMSESKEPMRIAIASSKNTSSFNSLYEYRLQQLLPVLRQIDEAEAQKLSQKLKQLNPSLDTQAGPATTDAGADKQAEPRMQMMVSGGSPAASSMVMQMRQVAAIEDLAEKNPKDALTQAALLAPRAKAMALEVIARMTIKKDASVSRRALDQLVETAPDLRPEEQARHLASAADVYLKLEDEASARKAIEKGTDSAAKLFREDSENDNVNEALKAYWPSSAAWRQFIRLAARISEPFALSLVNEIPDPEIKAVQRLALVGDLLGSPAEGTASIVSRKDHPTQMMLEAGEGDSEREESQRR